eukprot:2660093-Prymnesium_polylepis.1
MDPQAVDPTCRWSRASNGPTRRGNPSLSAKHAYGCATRESAGTERRNVRRGRCDKRAHTTESGGDSRSEGSTLHADSARKQ